LDISELQSNFNLATAAYSEAAEEWYRQLRALTDAVCARNNLDIYALAVGGIEPFFTPAEEAEWDAACTSKLDALRVRFAAKAALLKAQEQAG